MAQASSQHKLDRVRPPRVHITYDVEIGNAIELKELPFQLGVLGDFTGMPEQPLARLRDRSFVEVNPDNFDSVMEGMKPHLAFTVQNRLAEKDGAPALRVDLHFKALDDFAPENVARQVTPLRELLDLRLKLSDLLGKLQGNDKLEELLTDAITNPDKLKKLESEIHANAAPVAQLPAVAAAISVEPEALEAEVLEPEALEQTEVEAETVSVSEEAAAPSLEAEPIDLAPPPEGLIEAPVEEEVAPTAEAAETETEAGAESAEPKKESEGSEEVHPAVEKPD